MDALEDVMNQLSLSENPPSSPIHELSIEDTNRLNFAFMRFASFSMEKRVLSSRALDLGRDQRVQERIQMCIMQIYDQCNELHALGLVQGHIPEIKTLTRRLIKSACQNSNMPNSAQAETVEDLLRDAAEARLRVETWIIYNVHLTASASGRVQ
ncbi:hypothetical protein BDZ89DRAFT_1116233 [Hymenopellis radicata]|nr:hypothetical protein BDZ89DRAFT_1116233 [Hymenopellis radicata]